ncbi:SDR family oxidoreductase [Nitrosopumilus sp.]|jgi:nucleoside-diphosphate-sugar epimerase|nr:SDR family oxidoreductase [Nitrosopumilus sp.]
MLNLKVLVTGGAGYVGSVLIPELINAGHFVYCLDRFFFGKDFLLSKKFENSLELIQDDIRWFDSKILDGIDVVMDLAALSNDPVGDLDPTKTYEINHVGRSRVAKLSKAAGVSKYILASSASIYGQQEQTATEESLVSPLTAYSKANRKAEVDILPLSDDNFSVTALRFSSIYGISPRMRFDLAVNGMVLDYFKNKKITIFGGNNKRPFLHINDAVQAYLLLLNSSKSKINGQIFNVGSDEQNYQISDLAKEVGNALDSNCTLDIKNSPDNRSYFASSEKIRNTLNFKPQNNVKESSKEILAALENNTLDYGDKTITVKWYNHIKNTPKLLEKLSINGKFL